jgi:hypothetical protein
MMVISAPNIWSGCLFGVQHENFQKYFTYSEKKEDGPDERKALREKVPKGSVSVHTRSKCVLS